MNAKTIENPAFKPLGPQEQSLSAIASLTAAGNTTSLKQELYLGLEAGLSVNEIKEALVQLYAYCGFPRSLNALETFRLVLSERKSRGIKDREGKRILTENSTPDKYEQGRKVLEELTKKEQQKPTPGFGEFAPHIDTFLKEHLFADIFHSDVLSYRQREWITVSALAAMPGVEPQLNAHIAMAKNVGIKDEEFVELSKIIEEHINREQANILRKVLKKPLLEITPSDMMVRISEIEILPEHLDEYKLILKEEAAQSVKIESGVIAIYPLFQITHPTQARIIEIYVDRKAYERHLESAHFKHYKSSTIKMVKHLNIEEMNALDTETMPMIFNKLKQMNMKDSEGAKQKDAIQGISNFPTGVENTAYAEYFTGKSWLAPLTSNKDLNVPIANVTFEPGCRNNWHKHTGGQLLIVVGGEGLYQERGKAARRIKTGDIVEIAPNVEHWHGATTDQWFSHLAIGCNPKTNENIWQEVVSEDDYRAANKI